MIYVLILYASITFHEAAHCIAYRALGYPVTRVAAGFIVPVLWWTDRRGTQWSLRVIPFGGYCTTPEWVDDAMPPAARAFTAAAGPIATLLAASLFLSAYTVVQAEPLLWAAYLNGTMGIFNLLPFLPLDGGRIAQAWLEHRNGGKLSENAMAAFGLGGLGATMGVFGLIMISGWQMEPEAVASVDTHAEHRDVKQARPARVGSAVGEAETPSRTLYWGPQITAEPSSSHHPRGPDNG